MAQWFNVFRAGSNGGLLNWSQHSLGWNVDMATQKVPVRILYEMAFSARESFLHVREGIVFPQRVAKK